MIQAKSGVLGYRGPEVQGQEKMLQQRAKSRFHRSFDQFRPSAAWLTATLAGEGDLYSIQGLNANLFQNPLCPTDTPQVVHWLSG